MRVPAVALLLLLAWGHSGAEMIPATFAFDTIAGPLPRVVKYTGRPRLVTADIEVPPGRLVVVEPGVVFLFKPFTGLHVQGRIEVNGTHERPVVFTSENDQRYNSATTLIANPYDWNGIYVHRDALGSVFEHVKVGYSVYGLVSETKFIRVEAGEFFDNGKSNLLIENTEHVLSAAPYSYALSTKDATVDGVPVKILRDPAAPRRNALRYAGLGLCLIGSAVGVVEVAAARAASADLDALSNANIGDPAGFDNLRYGSSSQWESAYDRRTWNTVGGIIGFIVGAAGAAGFIWSFTF